MRPLVRHLLLLSPHHLVPEEDPLKMDSLYETLKLLLLLLYLLVSLLGFDYGLKLPEDDLTASVLILTIFVLAYLLSLISTVLSQADIAVILTACLAYSLNNPSVVQVSSLAFLVFSAIVIGAFHLVPRWYETHGCAFAPVDYLKPGILWNWTSSTRAFISRRNKPADLKAAEDEDLVAELQNAIHMAQKSSDDKAETIKELGDALRNLKAQLQPARAALDEKVKSLETQAETIRRLTSELSATETARTTLEHRVDEQADQLASMPDAVDKKDKALEEHAETIRRLMSDVATERSLRTDLDARIAVQATGLPSMQAAVNDKTRGLDERAETIRRMTVDASAAHAALAAVEQRVEDQASQLASMNIVLGEKNCILAERDDVIQRLTSDLSTAQATYISLGRRLEDQAATITDVTDQLAAARQAVAGAEKAAVDSVAKIASLSADLDAARQATADAEARLSAQGTVVADLNNTLDLACETIAEKDELVKQRDAEILDLNNTLDLACESLHETKQLVEQHEATICDLHAQLDDKQARLASHANAAEELQQPLAEKTRLVEARDATILGLQAQLDEEKALPRAKTDDELEQQLDTAKGEAMRLQALVDRKDVELKQKTRALAACTDQLADAKRDIVQRETIAGMEKSELQSRTRALQARADALKDQLALKELELKALADDHADLKACLDESASAVSRFLRVKSEPSDVPLRSLRARLRWISCDSQRLLEQDPIDDPSIAMKVGLEEWNDLLEEAGLITPDPSDHDAWLNAPPQYQPIIVAPADDVVLRASNRDLSERLESVCHQWVTERAKADDLRAQLENTESRLAMCRTALDLTTDENRSLRLRVSSFDDHATDHSLAVAGHNAQIAALASANYSLEYSVEKLTAEVKAARAREQILKEELECQENRLQLCQATLRYGKAAEVSSSSVPKIVDDAKACVCRPLDAASIRSPLSVLSVNALSRSDYPSV